MKEKFMDNSEIFERGVENIITREELFLRLKEKRPLRIKHGIDITAPGLHIGHATHLWKIRALQEEGHHAVILLGDVTTTIGDPTGRSKTRPILSEKEININAKAIEKEVRTILIGGEKNLEIHRSSEWYKKMAVPQFLALLSQVTHARLIERDMFQARIKTGGEIFMHELIYPMLQGYDSVMLKSDLTVIGADQLFNEHMGRLLQERAGQRPQVIISLRILPGLEGGEKMSKSKGNFIGISDSSEDKFGKAMRVMDSLIIPYLIAYTDVSMREIKKAEERLSEKKNPMEIKLFFAEALVRRYHGERIARAEQERFIARFSRKEIPKNIEPFIMKKPPKDVLDLLVGAGLAHSRSEGRRLIEQGAVEIEGSIVRDINWKISQKKEVMVKVGKRRILKIQIPR